jgi:O-antigen ligase
MMLKNLLREHIKLFFLANALISIIAFIAPAASINLPDGLYFSAISLVFLGLLTLPWLRFGHSFSTVEKTMIFFWLLYFTFTLLDLLLRSKWDLGELQEPSRFLLLLPGFILIRHVGYSESALRYGILAGAIFAALWAYYQKIHLGIYRAWGGTTYSPAAFGDVGLICGVMSVALLQPLWREKTLWKCIALIGFLAGLFASLCSGTKGGWVSLPLLGWVLVELTDEPSYKKRFGALAFVIGLAALAYLLSPFIQDRMNVILPALYEYIVNGVVYDYSAGIRLALWHGCLLIFWDNPLFGTGPGTYWQNLMHYVEIGALSSDVRWINGPHSQLFNSLYESGIFGPFMVYGIYLSFILHCKQHLKQNKSLATAGMLLAVGFIDFGLVEVIWAINNAGVFFTMMMVLIAGLLSYQGRQQVHNKISNNLVQRIFN